MSKSSRYDCRSPSYRSVISLAETFVPVHCRYPVWLPCGGGGGRCQQFACSMRQPREAEWRRRALCQSRNDKKKLTELHRVEGGDVASQRLEDEDGDLVADVPAAWRRRQQLALSVACAVESAHGHRDKGPRLSSLTLTLPAGCRMRRQHGDPGQQGGADGETHMAGDGENPRGGYGGARRHRECARTRSWCALDVTGGRGRCRSVRAGEGEGEGRRRTAVVVVVAVLSQPSLSVYRPAGVGCE